MGFEPGPLAVAPATLPLSYALKPSGFDALVGQGFYNRILVVATSRLKSAVAKTDLDLYM